MKNLTRLTGILPFRCEDAEVTVTAERQDSPPRFTRFSWRLKVVTDESPHRISLLERNLHQYGTVSATLALAAQVDGEVVAVESLDD